MKKLILLSLVLFASCTDEKGAKHALDSNGYKDIKTGGYDFLAGGKDDVYVTTFTATAPNGKKVTGCVTKGWFKGSTIRLDD